MSAAAGLEDAILSDPRFTEAVRSIAVRSLLDDLPAVQPELIAMSVDWNHALLCASALTASRNERAVDAALRVVQGALIDAQAQPAHKRAAAVMLERMGNVQAVALAERRELLSENAWTDSPVPLKLDVIRRRLELTIPLNDRGHIDANPFQREFWTGASQHGWLSVSAPTSAGKSYIVKQWFRERASQSEAFRGVYLVPTRALVDEVSRDLRSELGEDAAVYVFPWDREIGTHPKEIFVLTQERLHLLQEQDRTFSAELLFIDEAQKVGDDRRGVLLQQVLDEAVRRDPDTQVLFASPSSENPAMLLEGAPASSNPAAILSEMVTVNQNLIWLDSSTTDSREWTVQLVTGGEPRQVGTVALAGRPTKGKPLALAAAAVGGAGPGNVVYVNGAADAESTAIQIAQALAGTVDLSGNEDVENLRELISKTIHPEYRLRNVLLNGVGFHYGNMPLIIRAEIERLFSEEILLYLVCTSTLLEGVNLPCRNLFARAPKRGKNQPMTIPDFWNLAGRAGRWGKEFRGNVVCVDTGSWKEVPRARVRQSLERATDRVLSRLDQLVEFIENPQPERAAAENPLTASVFSFLATRVAQQQPLATIPGVTLPAKAVKDLETRIRAVLQPVEVSAELMARHTGVSPTAMQVLLNYFRGHPDPGRLPLKLPETPGSARSYSQALSRCRDYLGTKEFGNKGRCEMLGILLRAWMEGQPLARLIEERLKYQRSTAREKEVDTPKVIRSTMDDVEQVARFGAPKYLACYNDVLGMHLAEKHEVQVLATDELTMMLELGVSRPSEVSLMSIGLARTSAIALSALILADDMSPEQALSWLGDQDLEQLELPSLVRRDIATILGSP